jgi:hypothetical protein
MIFGQDRKQLAGRAVPDVGGRTVLRGRLPPRRRCVPYTMVDVEPVAMRFMFADGGHAVFLVHRSLTTGPARHSEMTTKLLIVQGEKSARFSECALKLQRDYSDFDSAIPWFESSRPSQPVAAPRVEALKAREKPQFGVYLAWCAGSAYSGAADATVLELVEPVLDGRRKPARVNSQIGEDALSRIVAGQAGDISARMVARSA